MRASRVALRRRRGGSEPALVPGDPEPTGCWAADSTLYFGPDGSVRACCVNTGHPLGWIGEQSIREVWEGARAASLRSSLAAGDFSLGCQLCGAQEAAGDRRWSNAPQFDRFAGTVPGSFPKRLDFVLSNTCNLQCQMCSGELSSSIRAQREHRAPLPAAYGDEFFEELREYLPHVEQVSFLGGEPFLARESRRVMDLMLEMGIRVPTSVVTNGTQWNDRVARYLRELPIEVSVSVDGATAETVESLRVGVVHEELLANLDRYDAILRPAGRQVRLHYCFMLQNWHELGRFLLQADADDRQVSVVTVTNPERFSPFRVPLDEVEPVLAALEEEDGRIASQLGRNRDVWDRELGRLRRHVESQRAGADEGWVTAPTPRSMSAIHVVEQDEALQAGRRRLEAWSGRQPLAVHVQSSEIAEVDVPTWATPLDATRWVGRHPSAILELLADHFGELRRAEPNEVGRAVFEDVAEVGSGARRRALRSLSADRWVDGEHSATVLLFLEPGASLAGDDDPGPAVG